MAIPTNNSTPVPNDVRNLTRTLTQMVPQLVIARYSRGRMDTTDRGEEEDLLLYSIKQNPT